MLERDVEDALVRAAKAVGGKAYKWVSPGNDGVPDRIVLMPIPPQHRELVAKYLRMVELKAPGEAPTPLQAKTHERLRDLGFRVDVVDSKEAASAYFS